MPEETIIDRLQLIVDKKFGGNKSAFARAAQLSTNSLSNYLGARQSKPGLAMLEKIISNIDVDARWLITGQETPASKEVTTRGDYSPASMSGDISMVVGDAVLTERVKALEALIAEKDERISVLNELVAKLNELIAELKAR